MNYVEKIGEEHLMAWLNSDMAADAIYELIRRRIAEQTEIICIIGTLLIIIGIANLISNYKTRKMLKKMMEEQKKDNGEVN